MWPPRTLAITDRRQLGGRGEADDEARLVACVGAMAHAGVDAVQIRERDWADGHLVRVTRAVMAATRGTRCRVFVNERAHVAVAAGAHGVHLRGDGMSARRVRGAWPSGLLIGRSMHVDDPTDLADGTDVVVFGTVFASDSKGPGAVIVGVDALAAWASTPGMAPVVAVGGMALDRCEAVRAAGACGIAGIGVFARAWQQGESSLTTLVQDIHAVFRNGERAE
jgi:thiamine-phosphate pyrophosphorylase